MPSITMHLVLTALLGVLPLPQLTLAYFILDFSKPIVERLDPIISPGQTSGHVHTVMGANGFASTTEDNSLNSADCTTCSVTVDKSNYWVPNLYYHNRTDNTFASVNQVGGAAVYYLQRLGPGEDVSAIKAFPHNFRMVAGDPLLRTYDANSIAQNAIQYSCLYGHPDGPGFPSVDCEGGFRADITYPSCWTARISTLTTTKAMSPIRTPPPRTMAPALSSHPVHLPTLHLEITFSVHGFVNDWNGGGWPFVWSMGDNTGYGFHADFISGWNESLRNDAMQQCNNGGDITQCDPLKPYLQSADDGNKCTLAATVNEQVMGRLDKLPGNNSVSRRS